LQTDNGKISVIFVQFGNRGALEQHGFARNRIWTIEKDPPHLSGNFSAKVYIDLLLKPYKEDSKTWPHRYQNVYLSFNHLLYTFLT